MELNTGQVGAAAPAVVDLGGEHRGVWGHLKMVARREGVGGGGIEVVVEVMEVVVEVIEVVVEAVEVVVEVIEVVVEAVEVVVEVIEVVVEVMEVVVEAIEVVVEVIEVVVEAIEVAAVMIEGSYLDVIGCCCIEVRSLNVLEKQSADPLPQSWREGGGRLGRNQQRLP